MNITASSFTRTTAGDGGAVWDFGWLGQISNSTFY
jgi:hypothetical protein